MTKQSTVALNLDEMIPQDVHFELSKFPDRKFTLGAFTLRVQIWAQKTFKGRADLERILSERPVDELSQLAWHTLKEKDAFKDYDGFLDSVVTFKDRNNLADAVLASVGLSQPVLEGIAKQLEAQEKGNAPSPSQTTGDESTTSSQPSTSIPLTNS